MELKMNPKSISMIGILVAVNIILSRFSIHTWNLKIGFSFIPVVVAAILYGPFYGGLVAAIGDIVCAILFPVGAYFPGFTATAFLSGAVFGIFLQKGQPLWKIILSVLTVQIIGSLCINTFWISFLYGSPFGPLFLTRIYQTAAMILVQTAGIAALSRKLIPMLKATQYY